MLIFDFQNAQACQSLHQFSTNYRDPATGGGRGRLVGSPGVFEEDAESREKLKGLAQLIIANQRNGSTVEVNLNFRSEYARFEDAEPETTEILR